MYCDAEGTLPSVPTRGLGGTAAPHWLCSVLWFSVAPRLGLWGTEVRESQCLQGKEAACVNERSQRTKPRVPLGGQEGAALPHSVKTLVSMLFILNSSLTCWVVHFCGRDGCDAFCLRKGKGAQKNVTEGGSPQRGLHTTPGQMRWHPDFTAAAPRPGERHPSQTLFPAQGVEGRGGAPDCPGAAAQDPNPSSEQSKPSTRRFRP